MNSAESDARVRSRDHNTRETGYSGGLSADSTAHTELQLRVGWLERRQVLHTNLRKGDWKLAAIVYLLLAIIAAPFF